MPTSTELQKAPYDKRTTRRAVTAAESAAFAAMGNEVSRPTARYRSLDALRALPRALMGGTEAMRAAGEQFLPRHAAESAESYKMRLESATLYNGFEQTVGAQAGKLFAEAVVLNDDVAPELQALAENIDGQGRALTPFVYDMMKEAFVDGISYILVDAPSLSQAATLGDQRAQGSRPYWTAVLASQVIGWRTESVNGQQMLTQVRITEETQEPKGEYGEETVQRVRVLEPGSWEVWRRTQDPSSRTDHYVLESAGASTLNYIPLVPVYTNRTAYFEGEPPLRSLAELNREHWISSSEQRYALTFSRFAMLSVAGVDEQTTEIVVGPNKVLRLPAGATAQYIEPSGAAINAGLQDLQAIEQRMTHAGMQIRVEQAGQVTATAAAIDSAESNAALKAVAHALEDAIEQALQMTADYLGLMSGGSAEVYDEFAEPPPQGTVGELTSLSTLSKISLPTLWYELKRRRVLSEDFDPAAEFERIMIEQAMYSGMAPEQESAPEATPNEEAPPDGAANPDATEEGDSED